MSTGPRRAYVDVGWGQMHVVTAGPVTGSGDQPVVLLHQTPRSWDEFAEVIPRLASRRPVIAVDLPGMGGSDAQPSGGSIELMASGVVDALDAFGVGPFDLVGHHTGGVVAFEVAARAGVRVHRLVLSSTPFVDAAGRAMRAARPPIDAVEVRPDGSHLTELWQRRQRFYPDDRPDLLSRFVSDALRCAEPETGHRAVAGYVMEDRVLAVTAKILLVGHGADPYAFPELDHLAAALGDRQPPVTTAVIPGGTVPLEFTASEFAAIVDEFLGR